MYKIFSIFNQQEAADTSDVMGLALALKLKVGVWSKIFGGNKTSPTHGKKIYISVRIAGVSPSYVRPPPEDPARVGMDAQCSSSAWDTDWTGSADRPPLR